MGRTFRRKRRDYEFSPDTARKRSWDSTSAPSEQDYTEMQETYRSSGSPFDDWSGDESSPSKRTRYPR
jgi:hypothetical protein